MRILLRVLVVVLLVLGVAVWIVLSLRADLSAWEMRVAPDAPLGYDGVTASYFGVSTLLFDDGETQLLTDGFFSRPGLLALLGVGSVAPEIDRIEGALERAAVDRLVAVFAVHSHYDHAMDVGEVALRTGASVVGSRSTANVARGAGVPESQIVEVVAGAPMRFGAFTVTVLESRHAPIVDGRPPIPGEIAEPLVPPASVRAWREGGSFSILIEHPRGSALVQGSAGYLEGALAGRHADVVFLGIGGLDWLPEDHMSAYFTEVVQRVSPTRIYPVHWDDLTQAPTPGELPLSAPRLASNAATNLERIDAMARPLGIEVLLPRSYRKIALY